MEPKQCEEKNTVPITERPNELTQDIDIGSPSDIVRILRQCDSQIFSGWKHFPSIYDEETIFAMEKIAEKATEVLQQSGAIVLSGCGTSGRIAFLLAQKFSDLAKEQGLSASYEYLIAGGDITLFLSREAPEDDWKEGQKDLAQISSNKTRVLYIGITCGLSAPYVAGQLDYCMSHPDVFIPVLLGFNPVSQARKNAIEGWSKSFFDVACALQDYDSGIILNPVVGPEAITGSSRMKGGSATKILLECILLKAHITVGKSSSVPACITLYQFLMMYEHIYRTTYFNHSNISKAVELAAKSLQQQGHVYYIGWGSSGLMGLLDASECVPTFSAYFDDLRGFLEGGYSTLKSKEGEHLLDGPNSLQISLKDFQENFLPNLTLQDTVVFICPEGRVFQQVRKLVNLIEEKGAHVIGIAFEKKKDLSNVLGSKCLYIELKQQSRQEQLSEELHLPAFANVLNQCLKEISIKWILNAISTGAHVLKGKVLGSFMIDLKVSNNKLFHRAVSIVSKFARVSQERSYLAVLQSIYRSDVVNNFLNQHVSKHVAIATVMDHVVPVAILVATDKFNVESALELLRTNSISLILRNLWFN